MVFTSITTLLLLSAILLVVALAEIPVAFDVENIKDPEMKSRVAQILAETGEDPEPSAGRAPSPNDIAAFPIPPFPVCGVFILCEQGRSGLPEARLYQGTKARYFPRTTGACNSSSVTGKCGARTSVNHARLWPFSNEEFNEMCFYYERKHACTSGAVEVVKQTGKLQRVVYRCNRFYDAHTVQFCLSRFSFFCRRRNPADVTFGTISPDGPFPAAV